MQLKRRNFFKLAAVGAATAVAAPKQAQAKKGVKSTVDLTRQGKEARGGAKRQ